MGKQVRFFMTSEDEQEFFEFVKATGATTVLTYTSPTPDFRRIDELPSPGSMERWADLWLFNSDVSTRIVTEFVPKQGYYTIDREKSSVVEFTRSMLDGDTLRPGRLWVHFTYVNADGKQVQKEPEFQRWYEMLVRWIRKNYSRDINPDFYSGPGAVKLVKKGEVEVRYY